MKVSLIALFLMTVTVLIHGLGSVRPSVLILRRWQRLRDQAGPLFVELLQVRLVGILLALHLLEVAVWAAIYWANGLLPNFESSFYFSLASYTTVGYGDVVLEGQWRLLGPMEAALGILMLGWSTGILVAAITKFYHPQSRGEAGSEVKPGLMESSDKAGD